MPVQVSYPGVYVQEVPSGVRTIAGVSTSIAVFIGRTKQGPLDEPTLCLNFSDFSRNFSSDYPDSDMVRAVRLFFQNGGTQCYIMRIADGATKSEVSLKNEGQTEVLKVTARSSGLVGEDIRIAVTYNGLYPESTFNLNIFRLETDSTGTLSKTDEENWTSLTMQPNTARYAVDIVNQNSKLIEMEALPGATPGASIEGYSQSGRPIPSVPGNFWKQWRELLVSVGLAETGIPWTGTSQITTSGTYTGSTDKTYTFTVATGGTVGTAAIGWVDGTGNTGTITPTADTAEPVEEGIEVSFSSGTLVANEQFTVKVHPVSNRFRIGVNGGSAVDVDLSSIDLDSDSSLDATGAINNLDDAIQTIINSALPASSPVKVSFEAGPTGPPSSPGPATPANPQPGDARIVTSGLYTGTADKTYTFTIDSTGGTVETDAIGIGWDDGDGGSGSFTLAAAYSGELVTDAVIGAEGIELSFGTGVLRPDETFTVGVSRNNQLLRIASENGDVKIEPSATNDLAARLMLGTAQGGVEVSCYAQSRPAPNGMVLNPGVDLANLIAFAGYDQTAFRKVNIGSVEIDLADSLETTTGSDGKMYQSDESSITGHNDGVREKLAIIADAVNNLKASDATFKWSAEVWGSRIAIIPGEGSENSQGTISTTEGDGVDIGSLFTNNVRYYSLGALGSGNFQTAATEAAKDGDPPTLNNYRDAFEILDKEVDLFNLMILPADAGHDEDTTKSLWGPASQFCQQRRAFLLTDPPTSWTTVQEATHPTTGVNGLRIGLVKDHSAIYYPRLIIKENGIEKKVGASGAIAGLMARIDGSRGVWKAPAGTEADLRGVTGIEHKFSDSENGVLNPRGINTIRLFPNGIVSWGARTMDGDNDFGSEYKYVPIRRLALFMEESLYRGLKWVVFEPNDEPLWAQIRLNVGAFMHNLFRQGAFQGTTPKEAYFVKCDKETNPQNEIDLGIVNIWVGFAPLKPAEFVVLYLQQMAGQIQT